MRPIDNRRGFTLLESVVALAVLVIAGLALTQLMAETLEVEHRMQVTEGALRDENRLLAALTLLNREDLVRREGTRYVGNYAVTIRRDGLELFEVSVRRRDGAPDMVTRLYRPLPYNE